MKESERCVKERRREERPGGREVEEIRKNKKSKKRKEKVNQDVAVRCAPAGPGRRVALGLTDGIVQVPFYRVTVSFPWLVSARCNAGGCRCMDTLLPDRRPLAASAWAISIKQQTAAASR